MAVLDSYLARLIRPLLPGLLAELDITPSAELGARIESLENRVTNIENEAFEQLGVLIGVVVAEVESLRTGITAKDQALADALAQIEALVANAAGEEARQAEAVAAAVRDALALDSTADATRVLGYVDQLKAAAPTQEVPEVPVPDPGVPAEPPADSGVEVPEVPETPQPEPTPDTAPVEPGTDTAPVEPGPSAPDAEPEVAPGEVVQTDEPRG